MSEHSTSERNSEEGRPQGWEALKQHVLDHKVEVALWVTRIFTILFTFGYFVPLIGLLGNCFLHLVDSIASLGPSKVDSSVYFEIRLINSIYYDGQFQGTGFS
ncbi:hypothetical protein Cfor_02711 [Coptotermes formosanus]|uniref:Uncharacterized protein n=1 Tax=Coptotermes formosanus TaxID=36987 RepID=A0A6L2PIS7_COPFO|nr:hypothetical protein Cfor_02711 [Coptotermes formosanus]